jgi:hypothetical protein
LAQAFLIPRTLPKDTWLASYKQMLSKLGKLGGDCPLPGPFGVSLDEDDGVCWGALAAPGPARL